MTTPQSSILPPPPPGEADAEGWRRLHRVTPLLRGWKVIAVVLIIIGQQQLDAIIGGFDSTRSGGDARIPEFGTPVPLWLIVLGFIAVTLAVIAAWAVISWRATAYRIRDDVIEYRSGVLFKQQRQANLDRLQAVDVVAPFLARLLGLAMLKLEVAGGAGSDFNLAYLTEADAQSLRKTLLAKASGLTTKADEPAPEAPEAQVYSLPPDRLIYSTLAGGTMIWLIVIVIAVVVAVVTGNATYIGAGVIAPALGLVGSVWATFSQSFGFTVAASPDGVRLRHGLLEHRAQTVPPGRVQAVRIYQPLVWRWFGWWKVTMNVAGYAHLSESGQRSETTLVPVATWDELTRILPLVAPDLGDEDPLGVLQRGLTGTREHPDEYTCSPQPSRWLDPIGWRRHGFLVTRTCLLLRAGRLVRELSVVRHEKMQSLALEQGPLQRRLGLASVTVHSTPGPVNPMVSHLNAPVAAQLVEDQAARSRHARSSAGPERWMTRPTPPVTLTKRTEPTEPTENEPVPHRAPEHAEERDGHDDV